MIKTFTTDRGTLTVYRSVCAYIGALITDARQWTIATSETRVTRRGTK